MKSVSKIVLLALGAVFVFSLVAGCATNQQSGASADQKQAQTTKVSFQATEASAAGQYYPTSKCVVKSAESVMKDSGEVLKVTYAVSVDENSPLQEAVLAYKPKARQGDAEISDYYELRDSAWMQKVKQGESADISFYYPVGDYTDIHIDYGYGAEIPNVTMGAADIRFER